MEILGIVIALRPEHPDACKLIRELTWKWARMRTHEARYASATVPSGQRSYRFESAVVGDGYNHECQCNPHEIIQRRECWSIKGRKGCHRRSSDIVATEYDWWRCRLSCWEASACPGHYHVPHPSRARTDGPPMMRESRLNVYSFRPDGEAKLV